MTKREVLSLVAAIICTLAETNGAPESTLYMFVNMDMDKWTTLKTIMIEAKLITISGHYVRLTEQGRSTADKINRKIAV
jgi:hypothetical protein